ncbi:MAG: hypothetical protein GF330_03980 [Candidatus Eisenbacteria bacterium]|nr:hypothetical protein [Candidatus Eisenbacteria bacterium]
MRLRICLTCVLGALLCLPVAGHCSLSINEIMGDPASDWDGDGDYNYRDDEWVELFNGGPGHVNLGEYLLGDDQGLRTFGWEDGEVLSEGEALVIYGSQSLAWQQEHDESSYGFGLSNDGDCVVLWQLAGDDTLLVDTHTFNTHEADDDRSTGRNPDGTGDWEIFDALNPYGGTTPPLGNGLPPTPGWPNLDDPPSGARARSWGDVKALFR